MRRQYKNDVTIHNAGRQSRTRRSRHILAAKVCLGDCLAKIAE
jgi:hypothetical protein